MRDMSRALRVCLVALVLTNLAYVHLTQAVGTLWMLPLYGLAALAPVLVRFVGNWAYRAVWNLGVLAIFTLLLRHASMNGVHHLLEDGLILAAFCQVHLLNNLTPRQKPDLLFFNSFLITLVTSFFCQDLVYSLVFAVYATVLIIGMQLSIVDHRGATVLPRLVGDAARKAAVVLTLTIAAFLLLPRDFNREGLIVEELAQSGLMQVGFNERVELGRSGRTGLSNRVVLRVNLEAGSRTAVPTHWRGATCIDYGRGGWRTDYSPEQRRSLDRSWRSDRLNGWIRRGPPRAATVEVEVLQSGGVRLFAPLTSHAVRIKVPPVLQALADGTFHSLTPFHSRGEDGLRYEIDLHTAADAPRQRIAQNDQRVEPYLRIRWGLPPSGAVLAKRLIESLPAGASRRERVEVVRSHLASSYEYLLPGEQGAASDLESFLDGGGGHCEYFATAHALMLRSQDIPCRLVTGFCSNEWDETGRILTIRSRHAHAWVEVLDDDGRWFTSDATPAVDPDEIEAALSWWERLRSCAQSLWAKITSFDADDRTAALAWLRALPASLAAWSQMHTARAITLCAGLALAWVVLRMRRVRRLGPPVVRAYLRAMRRAGLQPDCGETPREALQRARDAGVRPASLDALAAATRKHERARYS